MGSFIGLSLFSTPKQDGTRGTSRLVAKDMTKALQGHLQEASLSTFFTMHSFRVGASLSRTMAGEAIEQIMQVGGWKTEAIARYYVEPSTKRRRAQDYSAANEAPLSRAFEDDFAACICHERGWVRTTPRTQIKKKFG